MKISLIEKFLTRVVWPRYQTVGLIITSFVTVFFAYQARFDFRSLEPSPQLYPITPQKLKEWGGEPTIVRAGMYIINFPEFDMVNNNFVLDGIVWFEFDPALVSLETVGKFSFEKGELKKKSEPDTKLIDTKLFAEYEIRLKYTSNLSYQFFPLDDHRIYISLVNNYVSPSDIVYEAFKPGFSLSEDIFLAEWQHVDHDVHTGYTEATLEKHDERKVVRNPKIMFSIDFRRFGIRQTLLILFPLFLIFFVSLFSLGLDPKERSSNIISLASGSVTSMIIYRFVIQRMSPEVGYFILGDHIFILFLVFVFIEFILGIWLVQKGTLTRVWSMIRGSTFLLFHALFIIAWYYLLFQWKG